MKAFYLIVFGSLLLIFSKVSYAAPGDTQLDTSGQVKQALALADKLYEEGKVIFARPIYRQYPDLLSDQQKIRLGFSLSLNDCDTSDFRLGADLLKGAYASGNKAAAPFLAWLYYVGKGMEKDTVKALELLSAPAADKEGWADYFNGSYQRRLKNYQEAFKLLSKAAKAGNGYAMDEIGSLYQEGSITAKSDYEKAAEWYLKAGKAGNASGYASYAWIYFKAGRASLGNAVLIFQNFKKAVEYGEPDHTSDQGLGHCYSFGIGVLKNIDSAIYYYRKAGGYGLTGTYSRIGYIYEKGIDVTQRSDSAVYNYARGANFGDSWAFFRLAKIFSEGILIPKNDSLAFKAISGGAELDDRDCQVELARYYKDGIGVERNLEKCREMLNSDALKDYAPAFYQLALIEDSLQRPDSAIALLKKSAEKKYSEAMMMLAKIYKRDLKAPGHEKLYTEWLDEAIKAGNTDALFLIGFEYCFGINRKEDPATGNRLITQAARQGNRNARDLIGLYPKVFGDRQVQYDIQSGSESGDRDYATDYEPPFSGVSVSAMDGNPDAQFLMGMKYFKGAGVRENMELAIQWFQQAAGQGHGSSYLQLGYMYETGQGFAQSYPNAMTWYEMAASKDITVAINNIGSLYYNGRGVPVDKEKAAEYYEKAAAMKDPLAQSNLGYYLIYDCPPSKQNLKRGTELLRQSAQAGCDLGEYNLGMLYREGKFIEKNEQEAAFWLKKAAAQNHLAAKAALYEVSKGAEAKDIAKDMTIQMAKAGNAIAVASLYRDYKLKKILPKEQEVEILAKLEGNREHLNLNDRLALIEFYDLGIGTEPDADKAMQIALAFESKEEDALIERRIGAQYLRKKNAAAFREAVKWYTKAVEKGDESSAFTLGYNYYSGDWTEVKDSLAFSYIKFAADKGHARARFILGRMYEEGRGVAADMEQAVALMEQAAEQGENQAMINLGSLYFEGKKVPKDETKGKSWLERAAKMNNVTAQVQLAYYLSQSKNKADQKQCIFWNEKAIAAGDATAMNNLGECYYQGTGVKKDYEKAIFYYQAAIDHNSPWGKLSLGTLYLYGHGVPKDEAKARELYRNACDEGIKEACTELAKIGKQ